MKVWRASAASVSHIKQLHTIVHYLSQYIIVGWLIDSKASREYSQQGSPTSTGIQTSKWLAISEGVRVGADSSGWSFDKSITSKPSNQQCSAAKSWLDKRRRREIQRRLRLDGGRKVVVGGNVPCIDSCVERIPCLQILENISQVLTPIFQIGRMSE